MFGAGRESDDEAAGLFDENGEGRFRFNGGSIGVAESGSCFGGMLDSGIAAVAGGNVSEAAGAGTAVGAVLIRSLLWARLAIRMLDGVPAWLLVRIE